MLKVCGSDGITYTNECKMKESMCRNKVDIKKIHEGECRKLLEITLLQGYIANLTDSLYQL